MVEEQSKDLSEYVDAFKRRRGAIVGIALLIFTLGLITAFAWPPTYRSTATILIEEQEIPSHLVPSTVTSYATQRIQVISQRVMTRRNLMEVINQYNLYENDRKRETTEEIIDEMREDVQLNMITADILDPRTGRPGTATIAFTVGFEGDDPDTVQKVASELTTLYLNENLKNRTEKAAETTDFLSEETRQLRNEIAQMEARLTEFKAQHINTLPELRELNSQVYERTEREIEEAKSQLHQLEDRRIYLQGELNLLEPYGTDVAMNPAARLKVLSTNYISLSARYSPDHPDVIKLKREIRGLEQELGVVDDTHEKLERLDTLRTELAARKEQYSDDHPDVVGLNKSIGSLEKSLNDVSSTPGTGRIERAPDNPAYVTLQSQLDSTLNDINATEARKSRLEKKLAEYERRLYAAPQVESEYRDILRDYESASNRYREIKAKQRVAEVGQELEEERKGERFSLIDPAQLPEEPVSPNRPAIVFLSLVLALGGGIGFAAVGESMDESVRGAKGLVSALNAAPLAVVPYFATDADIAEKRARRLVIMTSTVGVVVVALLLVHLLWTPLDVLWFRALREATIIAGVE
jgi:succinoglycan biosynthesis transport protein ExoP